MFRSIRFRLTLWYTVLVAITFLTFSSTIYIYISTTLSRSLDQSITGETEWLSARYERHLARREPVAVTQEDIRDHTSFNPFKEYVEVRDSLGNAFYRSRNLGQDTLLHYAAALLSSAQNTTTDILFRNHEIRLKALKTPRSTVLIGMPTESITLTADELLKIYAWLGPAAIIVAIAIGMFLVKTSFSKINEVIETAQRITADRLYDRIPEQHTKDEIGKIISTFNEMISRLDVSFRQMKQFSADASHELRTPLSVMRTQLERALDSKVGLADIKTIAANCLDETLHMSSIIENLLLLARADADQEVMKRDNVALNDLVREIYDESVIIASQKSISVTLSNVEEITIAGDRERLRQMLLNLIDNAVKYNTVNGKIEISLARENGMANITISDTGIGIPEQEQTRIFDRFYRIDRARSRELGGTGLGLSIVQWIVHAHGGTIRVVSSVNAGSSFCVSIPAAV